MKKDQIQIGETYFAKVSDKIVRVRIDTESRHGGWDATNLATNKKIRIKSAQRLRSAVRGDKVQDKPKAGKAAKAKAVDPDRCSTPRCKNRSAMTYLDRPLCEACWTKQCAKGEAGAEAGGQDARDANVAATEANVAASTANVEAKTRRRKKADQPRSTRLSALDAAAQVLQSASAPMRCKEMVEAMAAQGLWSSPAGKTPSATIFSAILREITTKGRQSRFKKADRGQFVFNG